MNRKTFTTIGLFALFLVIVHACTKIGDGDGDGRMGEEGNVRFSGGGGCNSSTTLAVGSTATMTLEPQDETLPGDLSVRSTEPAVIDATQGASIEEVILEAHVTGETEVELVSGGEVWDWLGFDAEPAASVDYVAGDAVFAGGTYWVKIDEVYGACGEDCPLIGGEFIVWDSAPAAALTLDADVDRTAFFTAGTDGDASILGSEPSGGASLVDHAVTIVDVASASDLDSRIVIMLPDETVLDPQPMPVELPVGSLCQIQFLADAGTLDVPISRFEVDWTVEGDTGVLEEYTLTEYESPEGPLFTTLAEGSVSIQASVPLIDRTGTFDLIVTAE